MGAGLCNALTFVGSWVFFNTAAAMHLALAPCGTRPVWLSAAIQFAGTLLFNLSTGAFGKAHAIKPERRLVWTPDAAGSLAFLLSGILAVVAVRIGTRDGKLAWLNLIGCIAFAVSAVGAFVRKTGVTEDELPANLGTFVGAWCFLVAALLSLPQRGVSPGRGAPTG